MTKPKGNWRSKRSGKSQPRQRVEDALAKGSVRDQVRDLGKSDRSRLLMFGDLFLLWSETIVGRVLIATVSLVLAWAILYFMV